MGNFTVVYHHQVPIARPLLFGQSHLLRRGRPPRGISGRGAGHPLRACFAEASGKRGMVRGRVMTRPASPSSVITPWPLARPYFHDFLGEGSFP